MANWAVGLQIGMLERVSSERQEVEANRFLHCGGQILSDAFPIKDMMTLGLDSVLGELVAESAYSCFSFNGNKG